MDHHVRVPRDSRSLDLSYHGTLGAYYGTSVGRRNDHSRRSLVVHGVVHVVPTIGCICPMSYREIVLVHVHDRGTLAMQDVVHS